MVRASGGEMRGLGKPQAASAGPAVSDLPELGKHPRTAPGRLTCSSEGVGTNRGCPWMTAADRCLGHVGGTAGEDDVARSLSATVASLTGG